MMMMVDDDDIDNNVHVSMPFCRANNAKQLFLILTLLE